MVKKLSDCVPVNPTFLRHVAQRFFFFFPSLSRASAASLSPSATELLKLLLLVAADRVEEAAPTLQKNIKVNIL